MLITSCFGGSTPILGCKRITLLQPKHTPPERFLDMVKGRLTLILSYLHSSRHPGFGVRRSSSWCTQTRLPVNRRDAPPVYHHISPWWPLADHLSNLLWTLYQYLRMHPEKAIQRLLPHYLIFEFTLCDINFIINNIKNRTSNSIKTSYVHDLRNDCNIFLDWWRDPLQKRRENCIIWEAGCTWCSFPSGFVVDSSNSKNISPIPYHLIPKLLIVWH